MPKTNNTAQTRPRVYPRNRVGSGDIPRLNACLIGDEWVHTNKVSEDFWRTDE